TAFSMATAVDHGVNRWVKTPVRVSTMQIWARYHMSNMARADMANLEKPLAPDNLWPYSDRVATSWLSPDLCRVWGLPPSQCGHAVDQTKLADLDGKGVAEIDDIARIDNPHDTTEMKVRIAAGQDVWIGIHVGPHWSCGRRACYLQGKNGGRYIQDYDDPRAS